MQLYDFIVKDTKGNDVSLKKYEGKVLLIVNTATKCGLTPQYTALESLYKKYHDYGPGFEILDFPCNQFLKQAPGSDNEIDSFCTLTYNTTFPRFGKIDVNGKNTHPLYQWLKENAPADQGDTDTQAFDQKVKLLTPFSKSGDIKWNFGKFLINIDGTIAGRYAPAYAPEKLENHIKSCLER